MNSIRPLITITILVVVGAFLYVKINEGPVGQTTGTSGDWPTDAPAGVPPLAVGAEVDAETNSAAPLWSANTPATSNATGDASPAADVIAQQPAAVPAVPPIPEIPEETAAEQPVAPAAGASIALPTELPANIPVASYPGDTQPNGAAAPTDVSTSAASPSAAPSPDVQPPTTPEEANERDVAAAGIAAPPLVQQENSLRQSPAPTASDRYAAAASPATPADVAAPDTKPESFATSWPNIQATLEKGELAQAHELLSRWYDDPSLTPTDAELVNKLLSQLAGTVVYSTEHRLEPPYVVKPGETLETIATECKVPWQLLGKINGISAADQVQPGQELKVVRGPFSAVIDLARNQLTLMVDDRYAGKFPVTVPSAAGVSEGTWVVDRKAVVPGASLVQSAYAAAPSGVERAIVLKGETDGGPAAATLTIASGEGSATAGGQPPAIRVSPRDAEELSDILSIGSRVVIRR